MKSRPTRLKFASGCGVYAELKRRVDDYVVRTGRSPRDMPQMYVKALVLVAWAVISYALLVLAARAWWQALPLSISLGMALAGIGFNLQHDGGHGAFSRRQWINRIAAWMLDVLGGSSYIWSWKHNVFHHTYPNVSGADDDIDGGPLLRMSPHQARYEAHRLQHIYVWLLYGLLPLKWQLWDDFRSLATGRIAGNRFPRPRCWQLLGLVTGKAVFVAWALLLPLALRPALQVLPFFLATSFTLGLILSLVFQLAHCVEEADFTGMAAGTQRSEHEWAVHQMRTTVDFAPGNRLLSWYIGGLNFQIEHHLFPHLAHAHYPAIAEIVRAGCADWDVPYTAHRTLRAALGSHVRWLRRLGLPESAVWMPVGKIVR